MNLTILQGDWIGHLRSLPDESIQCCVTSPPYWGLRDYGTAKWEGGDDACDHLRGNPTWTNGESRAEGSKQINKSVCRKCGAKRIDAQLGLEKTPEEYVAKMVAGFREVRRVLKKDGTLWLNLGDSYATGTTANRQASTGLLKNHTAQDIRRVGTPEGLKTKDLVGIPWMVAFALRSDGWWLRSEITWCKKVPMPESVTDRPTSATEKIFLLSKSSKYFYDAEAVRNPPSEAYANDPRWQTGATPENEKDGYADARAQNPKQIHRVFDKQRGHSRRHAGFNDRWDAMEKAEQCVNGSNMRNFWLVGPEPYPEAHFATFPTIIPKRCILAGSKAGDTILDPFGGSGTTGMVALELGRKAVLIELNPQYVSLIEQRCDVTPGLPL